MKKLIFIAITLCSLAANAVDLRNATNRQILDELEYRLNGPGGGVDDPAILTAYCDRDDLTFDLTKADGTIQSKTIDLFDATTCNRAVTHNKSNLGSFTGLKLVQFCDRDDLHTITAHSKNGLTHKVRDLFDEATCLNSIGQQPVQILEKHQEN